MSEFKCAEPGCDYHVGISNGPNLTPEDWESEDYYFQEIEDHQQMHEESKRDKAARMVAAQFRGQLEERDKMCRVCGEVFESEPSSYWSAARAKIFRLDDVMMGVDYLALIHRSCVLPIAMRVARHPLLQKMIEENKARDLEVTRESEPNAVPGDVAGSAVARISEFGQQCRVGIDIFPVRFVELDLRSSPDIERNDCVPTASGEGNHTIRIFLEPFADARLEGQGRGRMQRGSHVPVDGDVQVQISLSVGGAPRGAVGGTSESTERDLTPGVPEMKEHPAAATAGCDETKHSNGK